MDIQKVTAFTIKRNANKKNERKSSSSNQHDNHHNRGKQHRQPSNFCTPITGQICANAGSRPWVVDGPIALRFAEKSPTSPSTMACKLRPKAILQNPVLPGVGAYNSQRSIVRVLILGVGATRIPCFIYRYQGLKLCPKVMPLNLPRACICCTPCSWLLAAVLSPQVTEVEGSGFRV